MIEEVEAGRVEAIIIKDMSRLGRDYLKVGQVMEILRIKGVRLLAINDSSTQNWRRTKGCARTGKEDWKNDCFNIEEIQPVS